MATRSCIACNQNGIPEHNWDRHTGDQDHIAAVLRMGQYSVNVITPNNEDIQIDDVNGSTTIRELKVKIQPLINIAVERMRMANGGQQMRKNNGTLIDYSIGPGVYIYVAWDHDPIILRAGGESKDDDDFPPEMDGFCISAKPEDGKQLRALIQELADNQNMPVPDGPRIGAEQIADDFRNGAMYSMVAIGPKGEMAAYAVYYRQPSSSSRGKKMHREDLYIRPQFRHRGLGIKLLRELAIVLLDEPGQISERKAQQLADQWNALIAGGEESGQNPLNSRARTQLQSGQLGAIVVQRKEQNDEAVMNGRANNANIIQNKPSSIVGMAFFHRQGYSSWQEKLPELDNIYVAESSRHLGIGTTIMAELTKIAKKMGATKVQWTAPEPSKQKCQHVPFFESLNAANLTDIEERLLNKWNYEKSGMHSSAAAGGDKANSNGNGAQRKEC